MKAQMVDTFADAGKPLLSGLAEAVDSISAKIKEWGPKIKGFAEIAGNVVGALVAAFKGGKLGEMIKLSLIVAGKAMVSTVVAGLAAGFASAGVILKSAFSKIQDPKFWDGVLNVFKSGAQFLEVAGLNIAASLRPDVNFKNAIKLRTDVAEGLAKTGIGQMVEAGDGRKPMDVLGEAKQKFAEVFKRGLENPLMDGTADQAALMALYHEFNKLAEAAKAAREARKIAGVGAGGQAKPSMAAQASGTAFFKPVVSSLQRIGGGRVGESIGRQGIKVALDRTRNKLLTSIDRKIGLGSTAVFS